MFCENVEEIYITSAVFPLCGKTTMGFGKFFAMITWNEFYTVVFSFQIVLQSSQLWIRVNADSEEHLRLISIVATLF